MAPERGLILIHTLLRGGYGCMNPISIAADSGRVWVGSFYSVTLIRLDVKGPASGIGFFITGGVVALVCVMVSSVQICIKRRRENWFSEVVAG